MVMLKKSSLDVPRIGAPLPQLSPFHVIGPLTQPSPLLLTCDHASNHLPPELSPSPDDLPWLDTHWGYDIGAATLTSHLSARLQVPAALSHFSRLVADPNRDPRLEHDWIPTQIEGQPLTFNQALSAEDRARRLLTLHEPYHRAITSLLDHLPPLAPSVRARTLLAVHSFTPNYPGASPRPMHAGVMFNHHPPSAAAAIRFAAALQRQGIPTALNEPYSGLLGTFYSVTRHGEAHDLIYLQLEVRQDLLGTPDAIAAIATPIAAAISAALLSDPTI
jgi:predicted N-formylglutamate amidohydrolase